MNQKMMKRINLFLLFFSLLWSSSMIAQDYQLGVLKVETSFLKNRPGIGSAIAIGKKGGSIYFITAKHVVYPEHPRTKVREMATSTILRDKQKSIKMEVDPDHIIPIDGMDLAILKVEDPLRASTWQEMEFRIGDVNSLRTNDPVTVVGFPSGGWHVNIDQKIQSADKGVARDQIYFNSPRVKYGISGGALIKKNGRRLIGMVTGGQAGATNATAIRIDRILPILIAKGIPTNYLEFDAFHGSNVIIGGLSIAPIAVGIQQIERANALESAYREVDQLDGLEGLQTNAVITHRSNTYRKAEAENAIQSNRKFFLYSIIGAGTLITAALINEFRIRKKQKNQGLRK